MTLFRIRQLLRHEIFDTCNCLECCQLCAFSFDNFCDVLVMHVA